MQVKRQQLEPCREQLIGSRLRKKCDRAVCCHPVCVTYTEKIMRNAEARMQDFKHDLTSMGDELSDG